MERYNELLDLVRATLEELMDGLRGRTVMSVALDAVFQAMVEGRVPAVFSGVYYSSKGLISWGTLRFGVGVSTCGCVHVCVCVFV